jgi:hypothetical protein
MFLDELKTWLRSHLTLDVVRADELQRRTMYLHKCKHDAFYWCFPPESSSSSSSSSAANKNAQSRAGAGGGSTGGGSGTSIHSVVDFIHAKIKDALETITREEKNKSLQLMFKELNDHTMNTFEYGKNFLAFLVANSQKVGADYLSSSSALDGSSIEKGKLHYMLLSVSEPIFTSYVTDMRDTEERQRTAVANAQGQLQGVNAIESAGGGYEAANAAALQAGCNSLQTVTSGYRIEIESFSNGTFTTTFNVLVTDPDGHTWTIQKTTTDFKNLHQSMQPYVDYLQPSNSASSATITLPIKPATQGDLKNYAEGLCDYLLQLLSLATRMAPDAQRLLALFLQTRELVLPRHTLVLGEKLSNIFIDLKETFKQFLVQTGPGDTGFARKGADSKQLTDNDFKQDGTVSSAASRNSCSISNMMSSLVGNSNSSNVTAGGRRDNDNPSFAKDFTQLRTLWGITWTQNLFDAYAYLQRMCVLLSWTLELNYFFISMFGNMITFSNLPLREILATQREILQNFLTTCDKLVNTAYERNEQENYKFHKNLQLAENSLRLCKHHGNLTIGIITTIENEHLDYTTQLSRLQDVKSRFTPFMNRVYGSIESIQSELGLSVKPLTEPNGPSGASGSGTVGLALSPPTPPTNRLLIMAEPKTAATNNNSGVTIEEIDASEVQESKRPGAENKGYNVSATSKSAYMVPDAKASGVYGNNIMIVDEENKMDSYDKNYPGADDGIDSGAARTGNAQSAVCLIS